MLPDFAEAFTRARFSTITFNYRGFGDSDGKRGRLVSAMQIDDIISVVNWVREQPSLDAQRISLWGTSFGGCHVFGAAVRDPGIKCIIRQLAFADGKEMIVGVNRVLSDAESKSFFRRKQNAVPKDGH